MNSPDEVNAKPRPGLGRMAVICLLSFLVMAAWPAVSIWLRHAQLDHWTDAIYFLGGVTLIPALLIAVFGAPDAVILGIIVLVWLAALAMPVVFCRKWLGRPWPVIAVLAGQAVFSFAQAGVALLMLATVDV